MREQLVQLNVPHFQSDKIPYLPQILNLKWVDISIRMCSNHVKQHDDLLVLSGRGLKMLDVQKALVLCSDDKLAIVNKLIFYSYGKSTSYRNFRKAISECSISLECKFLKYPHSSGAQYQAMCAWVGKKPKVLSQEDMDKLPSLEGEEGKGIRLLDHNAALIACTGKTVILKRTCLSVNRRACDECNFKNLITCGQVIKVNAVPLPVPHSTGAQYKAVCAWVGDKPSAESDSQIVISNSAPEIVHCETQDLGRKVAEIPKTPLEVQVRTEDNISTSCSIEGQSPTPTLNKTLIHPAISSVHTPKLPLKDGIFIVGDSKVVASPFKLKSKCQNNFSKTSYQSSSRVLQESICNNSIQEKNMSNGGKLEYKQDALCTSQENAICAYQEMATLSKENQQSNWEESCLIKNTVLDATVSGFLSQSGEQREGDVPTETITELEEICGEVTAHITNHEGIIEVDILGFEVRFTTDHIVSWEDLDLKQKTLACLAPLGSRIMFCATRNPGNKFFHASKVWLPTQFSAVSSYSVKIGLQLHAS